MGPVHFAGMVRALGAGVRAALAVERLAELALHLVEVGLGSSLLLGGLGGLRIGLAGGRLGSGLLDGHADLLRQMSTSPASHTRGGFIEPVSGGAPRNRR